jgi:hypothetical protein
MSAIDHIATILLRLMRNRQRPAVGTIGSEPAFGHMPIPAKQREVGFSDFESVARLKERGGLGTDTRENWYRLWCQNPAIAMAKSKLSMGWVLETSQGIVGYQGSIPLIYQYGDRTLVAATGTSLVVEPAYRARSIGLLASFYRQQGIELFLITTAIPSVGKLSTALQAKALPYSDYDRLLLWVLDTRRVAKALATKLGLGSRAAAVETVLGSLALQTDIRVHRRRPGRITNSFRVTEIEVKDLGDDFEALWHRKLTEKPRLLADRSAASLRWHFTTPGSALKNAVLCCHRFERLVGYAIVRHTIDRETGMQRSMLADILVEQDDPGVTASLLEAAYWNAVTSGGHVFEVLGLPRNIRQILMCWKPYLRRNPNCPFFYKAIDQGLIRTLADENAWYAGPFDGDTTLM